jgi:hypothetical protein
MKVHPVSALVLLLVLLLSSSSHAFTIGGAVRNPLSLTGEDLSRFASLEARLTELSAAKEYNGVFLYQGVPLQSLLRMASIQKSGDGFNKDIDLAIVVRNKQGREVALSWGEVFYRNPSNVLVAFSAAPVLPHRDNCGKCHGQEFYQPVLDKLKRKVGLPKLVLANDFYSDRSLEDIVSIEVLDLKRGSGKKPNPVPLAGKVALVDGAGKSTDFTGLGGYPSKTVDFKNVGYGRGYHGVRRLSGVPVRELLTLLGAGQEPDQVLLVTGTDGYQGLYSYGEIFLSPLGDRIILSEQPVTEQNKGKSFSLVSPDDTAADRMIKDVLKIEVLAPGKMKKTP